MTTVQAPESLFPKLYSGAAKAALIGQTFARWLGSARRLPVHILRVAPGEEQNVLLIEEPEAQVARSPLRRLLRLMRLEVF